MNRYPRCRGKLSQSEVDRMVQEAEKFQVEDEINELKYEVENGLGQFRVTH